MLHTQDIKKARLQKIKAHRETIEIKEMETQCNSNLLLALSATFNINAAAAWRSANSAAQKIESYSTCHRPVGSTKRHITVATL